MKQAIILAIILMSGIALADDPNDMPNPTKWNPVTVCVDDVHSTVTIRYYMVDVDKRARSDKYEPVDDTTMWSWVNDPDFLGIVTRLYLSFPSHVKATIRFMTNKASWEESRAIYNRVESERTR